jgi:hypothetical protein
VDHLFRVHRRFLGLWRRPVLRRSQRYDRILPNTLVQILLDGGYSVDLHSTRYSLVFDQFIQTFVGCFYLLCGGFYSTDLSWLSVSLVGTFHRSTVGYVFNDLRTGLRNLFCMESGGTFPRSDASSFIENNTSKLILPCFTENAPYTAANENSVDRGWNPKPAHSKYSCLRAPIVDGLHVIDDRWTIIFSN